MLTAALATDKIRSALRQCMDAKDMFASCQLQTEVDVVARETAGKVEAALGEGPTDLITRRARPDSACVNAALAKAVLPREVKGQRARLTWTLGRCERDVGNAEGVYGGHHYLPRDAGAKP